MAYRIGSRSDGVRCCVQATGIIAQSEVRMPAPPPGRQARRNRMPRLRQAISRFSRLNLREQRLETKSSGGTLRRFFSATDGSETVEYAVMTALIVAAVVTGIGLLTGAISGRFDTVRSVITGIGAP